MCALQKAYTAPQNVSGNYWRIFGIERFPKEKVCTFILKQFLDAAASAADNDALDHRRYEIVDTEYDTFLAISVLDKLNQNEVERLYTYLKDKTSTALTQNAGIDFTTGAIDIKE